MKIKKSAICKTSILALLFFSLFTATFAQDASAEGAAASGDQAAIDAGGALFNDNCTSCHAIHRKVVGPALKDVHKRRDDEWIKSFILNSQKVIQSGDEYAVKLFEEFGKTTMTSHDFNDDELNSIIAYIKAESEKAPEEDNTVVAGGDVAVSADSDSDNMTLFLVLIGALVVLIIVLVLIKGVLHNLAAKKDHLSEADREIVNRKFDLVDVLKSKLVRSIAILIVVLWGAKVGFEFVWGIGVQQGYKPDQPIEFSHRIHAGSADNGGHEIDCNYCHTGVRKSKHANIPSTNICMNCHSGITKDKDGKPLARLQPLFDAVEQGKPIEWIRIHNLPDLAYFNHSQHVKVGGIECQKCHGPIETMDVVEQHSDLTMGWCINCHRETEVNAKGNAYYDKLLELHEKNNQGKPMTVEDIGGLECAKCHY